LKIAVVGAGVAGLASAWLLDKDHEVTLFEKNDYLGGHAITVHFEKAGKRAYANPAFGYITPSIYPQFMCLLEILKVKLISTPTSLTIYSKPQGRATILTPRLSMSRLLKIMHPKMTMTLLELQRVLVAAKKFDDNDDWQTTLEEFMEREHFSEFVRNEIIFPWAAALGEMTIADIKTFSARAALKYPVHVQSGNMTQSFKLVELDGGVASYIQPLLDTLRTTLVKSQTAIQTIQKQNGQFILTDSTGKNHTFDQLVLASPAYETKKIIDTLAGTAELQQILSEFKYSPARIAVHGDESFMPPKKTDWSVYNTMFDGVNCEGTIWCMDRGEFEYFKSWITFADRMPKDMYSIHHLNHPMVTPAYFRAQAKLMAYSGKENLWFAGSYTQDIDSHESGIRSAIDIAKKLNPNSSNLKLLLK